MKLSMFGAGNFGAANDAKIAELQAQIQKFQTLLIALPNGSPAAATIGATLDGLRAQLDALLNPAAYVEPPAYLEPGTVSPTYPTQSYPASDVSQPAIATGAGSCSDPSGDPNAGCYRPGSPGWVAFKSGATPAQAAAVERAEGVLFNGNYGVNYDESDILAGRCVSQKCLSSSQAGVPGGSSITSRSQHGGLVGSLLPAALGAGAGYYVKQGIGAAIGGVLGLLFGGRIGSAAYLPKDVAEHWAIAWAQAEAADAAARAALRQAQAAQARAEQLAQQSKMAAQVVARTAQSLWEQAYAAERAAESAWSRAYKAQSTAQAQGVQQPAYPPPTYTQPAYPQPVVQPVHEAVPAPAKQTRMMITKTPTVKTPTTNAERVAANTVVAKARTVAAKTAATRISRKLN
jgi:hypothetical protein